MSPTALSMLAGGQRPLGTGHGDACPQLATHELLSASVPLGHEESLGLDMLVSSEPEPAPETLTPSPDVDSSVSRVHNARLVVAAIRDRPCRSPMGVH